MQFESKWISCWKYKLGQPARTPWQVMQAYCDNNNITPAHLNSTMTWESWPDDVLPDDE